jgi:cytochrome P450
MTLTSDSGADTDLPPIPFPRDVRCPLAPPAEFTDWRETEGLRRAVYKGQPAWVVSRYQDIRAALIDPRLTADTIPASVMPRGGTDDAEVPVMFARMDDPEHNRLRRMMTRDFTVRRAEAMRPRIQELVDRYLDEMVGHGPPADLVRDFALPVPSMVIALLLGVPSEDMELFQEHTLSTTDVNKTEEEKAQAFASMFGYLWELVERKGREPGDDLMSRLVTDYVATGQLNRATAAVNGVIMMQAGHETTANMLALGTVALLENREVFELLGQTEDRATVANIVEELMRYLSIVHAEVERIAKEDFTMGGQQIRAGDFLVMNLPAGNWDDGFVDYPERLDVDRNTRGHLGFGYGVHQCIGQNLARAEMQIALTALARRLPGLRLAVPPEELSFRGDHTIYGMNELPVTW